MPYDGSSELFISCGDNAAFDRALVVNVKKLRHYAMLVDKRNPDDILQETASRAISSFRAGNIMFESDSQLYRWLATIMRNTAINKGRRKESKELMYGLAIDAIATGSSFSAPRINKYQQDYYLELKAVLERVATLPEHYQAAIYAAMEEKTTQEAAEASGINPGTANMHLVRGRKALSKLLDKGL